MTWGGRSGHRGRGAPPWWPAAEEWPPPRPPWHYAPQQFRRRFLFMAVGFLVVLIGFGVVIGIATSDWKGPPADGRNRGAGAWGLLWFAGFVAIVGGIATALAYRRISRPVGNLLGAAERLATGDYDVNVEPDGPRELRTLTTTFNDMAARLAASEEHRRKFLADITHELRTPLAVLQSGIEAQIDNIQPRDDRHLGSLLEETQRLGRLVDDLHTMALADAGRLTLHREHVHPAALVEDAVESHAALAERKGVIINSSVGPDTPEVDVDPARIHQVLANLLSNALRHTPAGGDVTVTAAPDDSAASVRFTVADSGPGIPADPLDGIFERFTRSSDSRGSGLGLSIARDLVHAHGGSIAARNRTPADGAEIGFTVPARGPEAGSG